MVGAFTGLIPYGATRQMLGWHIVWWSIAFEEVALQDARFASDLQALAKRIDPGREIYPEALKRFEPHAVDPTRHASA